MRQDVSGCCFPDVHHALAAKRLLVLPHHSLSIRPALVVQAVGFTSMLLPVVRILSIGCSIVITTSLLLARF